MYSLHLRMGSYAPPLWKWSICINYLKCNCTDLSFLLIYLFSNLYWYGLMDIYFIRLCNSILLSLFVAKILPAMSTGSCFNGFCVFFRHILIYVVCCLFVLFVCLFWASYYTLAVQFASCSFCIFPIPILESVISIRSLGSFCWQMAVEPKIWTLRCACF